MRVTIADVAREAGVSKTTVSRVLNAKAEVDASTADRVQRVIKQLGYVPSARAVELARGRSRTVATLVPSLSWPWMSDVLQGMVDTLEAQGYSLLLYTCNRGRESLTQFASQVSANSFDGLLVIEPEGTMDYITTLARRGLPVVLIDDREHHPEFPSVATTNREGASSAAHHLLRLGRRKPLVITGPLHLRCVTERIEGFGNVFAEAGHPIDDARVTIADFTENHGGLTIRKALAEGIEFDSVFSHNDLSAVGAVRALREAGRRVPDDIAVIGFDDIPLAAQCDPSLTTVRQPLRQMGEAATEMLLGRLAGGPEPESPTIIPTTLVTRESA